MALMKTSNPVLNGKTFENSPIARYGGAIEETSFMTLTGTVNKTGILLLCVIASAAWTWSQFTQSHDPSDVAPLLFIGLIGGFVVALITTFKQAWAPVTAPIYALLEGLVLGGISAFLNAAYPGIAIQAVCLTFGTLLVLLFAYRSGLIPVTASCAWASLLPPAAYASSTSFRFCWDSSAFNSLPSMAAGSLESASASLSWPLPR